MPPPSGWWAVATKTADEFQSDGPTSAAATNGPLHPTVRELRPEDVPQVGDMLARAFARDPTTEWLFPSARGRERRLARWYRLNVMALQDAGEGWVTDDLSAAALWLPMGIPRRGARPHLWRQLGLNLRIGLALRTRLLAALWVNLEVHRRHPREAAWYLAALGTEPDLQGRGLGTAVLQPVLRRCDQERRPATLDTVTAEDVLFYQRRGFEVVDEVKRPGAPHFRIMRRPPGNAGEAPAESLPL